MKSLMRMMVLSLGFLVGGQAWASDDSPDARATNSSAGYIKIDLDDRTKHAPAYSDQEVDVELRRSQSWAHGWGCSKNCVIGLAVLTGLGITTLLGGVFYLAIECGDPNGPLPACNNNSVPWGGIP